MDREYKKIHILFLETASSITVNLETQKVENWHFKRSVSTNYKTSDQCMLKFEKSNGEVLAYEGYVPDFFPGKHWGDYIMLDISSDGKVENLKPTDKEIDECIELSY